MARYIRKRQGPDTLPLTLARRRLYILPTRTGVGFSLLLLLMLVAGLNYANSLALFLTFLLTGFTLVTMHHCHRNLLGTQLVAATALPTFAQRDGTLSLTFESSSGPARYQIAAGVGDLPTLAADVPAIGLGKVEIPVPAPKRGIVRVDRLHLVTTHPFGLFRAWTWVHAPIEMLVYPRPHGLLPLPADVGNKSGQRSLTNAGADEWLGLRPFRDGDSPRQVDWKAYARDAPLLVKEYSAAGAEVRIFDLSPLRQLDTEAQLEQLARWIVDAEAGGERYGLKLPNRFIKPDHGPEHRHQCLAALAVVELEDAARGR
ncbi:MAG: DUF58 domain-containing protein [Proteobacteria bacterium]|nr:DUF58 domain-containing protein [Pseudomonadota bacterium]